MQNFRERCRYVNRRREQSDSEARRDVRMIAKKAGEIFVKQREETQKQQGTRRNEHDEETEREETA